MVGVGVGLAKPITDLAAQPAQGYDGDGWRGRAAAALSRQHAWDDRLCQRRPGEVSSICLRVLCSNKIFQSLTLLTL